MSVREIREMKKYGKYAVVCLLFILLFALGGCSGKKSMEMGQWTDNVFANSWFDIKVTIPDGYQVLDADEIQSLLGAGQKVIVNDGVMTEDQIEKSEGNTIYDFYVYDSTGTSSLALGYEKLSSSVKEETYLKIVKENLESLNTLNYEIGDFETVTVGKHEYLRMAASLNGGAVIQEYYVHRNGGYMGFLIVTYNESTKEEIQSVVQQIQ